MCFFILKITALFSLFFVNIWAISPKSESRYWQVLKEYTSTPHLYSLFTNQMKEKMFNDENIAPRFMIILSSKQRSSFKILNSEVIKTIGVNWSSIQESLVTFKVGDVETAERLTAGGEPIVIRFNDRESEVKSMRGVSYPISNGRQAYYLLPDGTWIGGKGSGAFNYDAAKPYLKKGKKWLGLLRDFGLRSVNKMVREPTMVNSPDCFAIPFAFCRLNLLPDGKGGWNSVPKDINPIQTFVRVVTPHRLEALPKLLNKDPSLKKLSYRISKSLQAMNIIPRNKYLDGEHLFYHIAEKMGKSEAIKENTKIYKRIFNCQDINFGGQECDSEDKLSPSDMKEYVILSRIDMYASMGIEISKEQAYKELLRINAPLWKLLDMENIWVDPLIAKAGALMLSIGHAMKKGEDVNLFPDLQKPFEKLFVSYFRHLLPHELSKWERLLIPGGMLEEAIIIEVKDMFSQSVFFQKGAKFFYRKKELGISENQVIGTIFRCLKEATKKKNSDQLNIKISS